MRPDQHGRLSLRGAAVDEKGQEKSLRTKHLWKAKRKFSTDQRVPLTAVHQQGLFFPAS